MISRKARLHPFGQIAAVFGISALLSAATTLLCFRHPANIVWMLAVPIVVAAISNRTGGAKAAMLLLLGACMWLGMLLPELGLIVHNELRPSSRIILACTYF